MTKHLGALASRGATVCVLKCCGLDACDFSAVHIAACSIAIDRKKPSRALAALRADVRGLAAQHGIKSGKNAAHRLRIDGMNTALFLPDLDRLSTFLLTQIASPAKGLSQFAPDGRDAEMFKGA